MVATWWGAEDGGGHGSGQNMDVQDGGYRTRDWRLLKGWKMAVFVVAWLPLGKSIGSVLWGLICIQWNGSPYKSPHKMLNVFYMFQTIIFRSERFGLMHTVKNNFVYLICWRCTYVCMQVCMYVCMSVYVCVYVCMCVCVYVCMCVCVYVCMYVCCSCNQGVWLQMELWDITIIYYYYDIISSS